MSDYGPSAGESFAVGFAQGFANTFVAAKQQQAREDADLVQFNMKRFINKQDQYNEAKKQDELIKDTALAQEKAYNLPEGSWQNIYVDLRGCMNLGQVQNKIADGIYTPSTNKKVVVDSADMEKGFDSSVDTQTE